MTNNIKIYSDLWNKIIMKITGAMLYPNRDIIELALQLPPLHIQLEILMDKFFCKAISGGDFITSILAQTECSLYVEFHQQILAIKGF